MSVLPLRFRAIDQGTLAINDTGRFFLASDDLVERVIGDDLTQSDRAELLRDGHFFPQDDAFGFDAHAYGCASRWDRAGELDYLILVPTLRCNLSCSYCQVSRVGLGRRGFDWDAATLDAILTLLDTLPTQRIKIEFQGGEPSLRPDLITAVIERCERFEHKQFVICTNLQDLSDDFLAILARSDVYISTSLDGDIDTHAHNRTGAGTQQFLDNLERALTEFGPDKVSALPTIDPQNPPAIDSLIDSYARRGLHSIFLRPINYQGFARKRYSNAREQSSEWRQFHERFVRRIIERNWADGEVVLEETYFSICLRRIFQPGHDRHVDLRNPNPMGVDYVVIDHDGTVYPTDESRMLTRSGVIDLSIGDVFSGWDSEKRQLLNAHGTNQFDESCRRCAYQPFCGRDLVDDLARYGRIDVERTQTEFCRRHLHMFDLIFEMVYSDDPAIHYSLARWLRLPSVPARFGTRL